MTSYKYLDLFPQPLKESIIQNRCLPIIGSGFSLNADIPEGRIMPDWETLGKSFASEIPGYSYSSTIDAISAYQHAYSRPQMVEKLKSLLLSGSVKPSSTHDAFCSLQFDIVCTTNFDHLIEDGYRKISKPCKPIISESQLSIAPMKDELTLLKIHGDIDYPDNIVATEEDYDKFLNQNPLLSTYLSNLLITRTPLFIGYSLDDDDFRQIWQVIKSRLGKMVRQAYVIKVNCSETEKIRYERRGVQVINIDGDSNDYPRILTELFQEIKTFWDDNVKNYGDNTSMSELALPKGSQTRLCYFSAPIADMSYYMDVIFPIAIKYGFIPITADSVVSESENWMAKVSSLISKIDYYVIDISSKYTFYEYIQINSSNDNILVFTDGIFNIPETNSNTFVIKKKDFIDNPDDNIWQVEEWFQKMSNKLIATSIQEPERLLNKNEYNAAVISAVVQFEVSLRKSIENITNEKVFAKGLYELATIAYSKQIVRKEDLSMIKEWISIRNRLVHSETQIKSAQAKKIVRDILSYTNKL